MEWLLFSGRSGPQLLAQSEKREDLYKEIKKFIKDHNFKSYYWRLCRNDKCVWIDVGSHSEFFYIFDSEDGANQFIKDGGSMKYRM